MIRSVVYLLIGSVGFCIGMDVRAAESFDCSQDFGGGYRIWSPLAEPADDTWLERNYGSMMEEVNAYADPGGGKAAGAPDQESPVQSKECIAYARDPYADVGKILDAGCQPTTEQMARLMDNPLGNVAMWINQVDIMTLDNEQNNRDPEIMTNYMGIVQFPKGITESWNLISRIVYSVPSVPIDEDKLDGLPTTPPAIPPGGGTPSPPPNSGLLPIDLIEGRTTGFGDMIYLGLASPKNPIHHGEGQNSVWGLGAGLSFPTASSDLTGSGQWSMGPSALYAYLGRKWKLGTLLQTYFSYTGDDDRADVRSMNLQLFYYYSITPTFSIGAAPNIRADFEADPGNKWTVPLGIGVSYTAQLGKIPVRLGLEFYGSVLRPDSIGNDFDLRIMIIPAVPSALIPILR